MAGKAKTVEIYIRDIEWLLKEMEQGDPDFVVYDTLRGWIK